MAGTVGEQSCLSLLGCVHAPAMMQATGLQGQRSMVVATHTMSSLRPRDGWQR